MLNKQGWFIATILSLTSQLVAAGGDSNFKDSLNSSMTSLQTATSKVAANIPDKIKNGHALCSLEATGVIKVPHSISISIL